MDQQQRSSGSGGSPAGAAGSPASPASGGAAGSGGSGDGKTQAAEQCDDGNSEIADGCEPDCKQTRVIQLVAGDAHTCALLYGGYVRCWGDATYGQLGYGNTLTVGNDETPASVGNVDVGGKVTALAAGGHHTCALLDDDTFRCWGTDSYGELGYG